MDIEQIPEKLNQLEYRVISFGVDPRILRCNQYTMMDVGVYQLRLRRLVHRRTGNVERYRVLVKFLSIQDKSLLEWLTDSTSKTRIRYNRMRKSFSLIAGWEEFKFHDCTPIKCDTIDNIYSVFEMECTYVKVKMLHPCKKAEDPLNEEHEEATTSSDGTTIQSEIPPADS